MANILFDIKNKNDFYHWLEEYSQIETECFVHVKKGKPIDNDVFYYLDAVEVALCFGWIDSSQLVIEGKRYQRFSPRRKNSYWTELNKERVRRLDKLGLLTPQGKKILPKMGKRSFKFDDEFISILKQHRVYKKFTSFHPLYQRVKASNLAFYKKRDPLTYNKMLDHLLKETRKGKMFGEWNDYGRLLNY